MSSRVSARNVASGPFVITIVILLPQFVSTSCPPVLTQSQSELYRSHHDQSRRARLSLSVGLVSLDGGPRWPPPTMCATDPPPCGRLAAAGEEQHREGDAGD